MRIILPYSGCQEFPIYFFLAAQSVTMHLLQMPVTENYLNYNNNNKTILLCNYNYYCYNFNENNMHGFVPRKDKNYLTISKRDAILAFLPFKPFDSFEPFSFINSTSKIRYLFQLRAMNQLHRTQLSSLRWTLRRLIPLAGVRRRLKLEGATQKPNAATGGGR